MHRGQRYIDSDAHVLEPSDLWERYLDPKFRDAAPRHEVGYRGSPPSWTLDIQVLDSVMPSFPMGQGMAVPGLEEAYADYIPRGFDAACYKQVLERTGIDYMVVYPTVGLYITGVPGLSPAVAAASSPRASRWNCPTLGWTAATMPPSSSGITKKATQSKKTPSCWN